MELCKSYIYFGYFVYFCVVYVFCTFLYLEILHKCMRICSTVIRMKHTLG